MDAGMRECAVDWSTFSPATGTQVDKVVSTLGEHGWKVTERRAHEKAALTSLVKGPWTLQVVHRTPEGNDYLSLLAMRESEACEEAAENAQ